MAIEWLRIKLYFYLLEKKIITTLGQVSRIPAKHASVMRKGSWIRFAMVWLFSMPFIMLNLYPVDFRLLTYAEAKLRLEATNPGLADQCKLWKSSEPYNWRRTDGRELSDPYDNYHPELFEKIPADEMVDDGSRYYHTTLLSFDHCVIEGWLWSVWEIVAIVALAFSATITGYDLLIIGPDLEKKQD